MRVHVGGLAVLGPGLEGWEAAREVLAGRRAHDAGAPFAPPAPASLPPAERRRATAAIRLGTGAAGAAVAAAGLAPAGLASVFASSNGDGAVVGAILEALAASRYPAVSPTLFHNSVHNAPAAYWGIASGSAAASTSLGCHDDTFPAGLLHAAAKALRLEAPVLLCAYDTSLPPPLAAVRATAAPFAAAMVLTPGRAAFSVARLEVRFVPGPPPEGSDEPLAPALLPLHRANAIAARSLRLLEILARGEGGTARLRYLGDAHLAVEARPC